eukprot:366311-Chlamydomonas_euryale.AAC.4
MPAHACTRIAGRQAVLRDDEVERLERASRAACASASRTEVMESMYGRLDPKPLRECLALLGIVGCLGRPDPKPVLEYLALLSVVGCPVDRTPSHCSSVWHSFE